MNKNIVGLLLVFFVLLSILIHIPKAADVPCFNSDEAAFSYNAYSILKTGRDEYGKLFPVRFKSFGENKLPVTEYLQVPFIALFGLNEVSSRMVIYLFGILAPVLFYFFSKELFGKQKVALIAAFLSSLVPWIQMLSRSIHEDLIAYTVLSIAFILLLKFQKNHKIRYFILSSFCILISLLTYHVAKVISIFWLGYVVYIAFKLKNNLRMNIVMGAICILPFVLFLATELAMPTNRISNLLFFQNKGFSLSINELRSEHNSVLIHNKLTYGSIAFLNQYVTYFAPDFLVVKGDENPRFGYQGVSPITIVEYVFLFIGLYYLFKLKEKHRYFLLLLLLMSPVPASLAWLEHSLTRSFFMIVPILLIGSYGFVNFISEFKNKKTQIAVIVGIGLVYSYFLFFSWDFYFNHYPKRPLAIQGWQCGNREMIKAADQRYDKTNKFFVTRKNGQPYIFFLFYNKYDPLTYQKQAKLSAPDQYGFGQVERFDKYDFNFNLQQYDPRNVYIGYPDDFPGISDSQVDKIKVGTQDIFWIYPKSSN